MNEQGTMSNRWFYKIYGIYGGLFLLLCAGMLISCFQNDYMRIAIPAGLVLMIVLLLLFLLAIKKGVLGIFQQCNQLLDEAIAGKVPSVANEETQLALFQSKLARFVAMRDKAFRDAKVQKTQIETLLANISHQTKTPIANILLYSQLLTERTTENRELVERLVNQSEKLQFLIRRLVEMSRLENGIIRCRPGQENVKNFLLQVIGDYYEKAQAKGMELSMECPEQVTAAFDAGWMREAVGNLVDNAIKYTARNGKIRISVVRLEMFVRISISDNGMGIDEEEIPKLFARFFRGQQTAGNEGLGLGLYLSREMVAAQRGYIKVSSQKGKGSDFQVFIPADF